MPPRRFRALLIAMAVAAIAGGGVLFAQPFAAVEDRRRAVGDWLVEHVGEEDGGRLVRMTREGDDHVIEYRVGFWRGNPGPVRGGTVMRLNGMCGGYQSPPDPGAAAPAATIRAELAGHLAQCGVTGEAAAATLEGFERAYALVSAWAEDAAAATAAAVDHGQPGIYNIVDDEPAPVREWLPVLASALDAKPPRRVPRWLGRLAAGEMATVMMTDVRGASNAKAKRELGWQLRYPSWRLGFTKGLG